MNNLVPYAIVAVVCFALGASVFKSCEKEPPMPTHSVNNITITVHDTIRETSPPRISYRDRVVTQIAETPKDSCCTLLERCWLDQFYLTNLEIEVEKSVENGSIIASFSMPRHLESGSGFDIQATYTPPIPQVIEVRKPRTFWDGFGAGIQATAGIDPFRKDWSVVLGVGVHYDLLDR